MIPILAETGEKLTPKGWKTHKIPTWQILAVILGVLAILIAYAGITLPAKEFQNMMLLFGIIFGLTAVLTTPVVIYYDYKLRKTKRKAEKFVQRLKTMEIQTDGRVLRIPGVPIKMAHGEYLKIKGSDGGDLEYMVWSFKDEEPTEFNYVFTKRKLETPVHEFEDFYVALIPPGQQYVLRLSKNAKVSKDPDKARLIQTDSDIEFHYVAGKSRNARVDFEADGIRATLARADGIPFQKLRITAGETKDVVAVILPKPRLGRFFQEYQHYISVLYTLGMGRYVSARGKVRLVLDFPATPDVVQEVPAEFTPINGTAERTPSETPF